MVLQDLCVIAHNALTMFRGQQTIDTHNLNTLVMAITTAFAAEDVNMKNDNIIRCTENIRNAYKQLLAETDYKFTIHRKEVLKTVEKILTQELTTLLSVTQERYKPTHDKINAYLMVTVHNKHKMKAMAIGKMGHYYTRMGWEVGIICSDTFGSKILNAIMTSPNCVELNVRKDICQIICYYLPRASTYNMCHNVSKNLKLDCYAGNYEKDDINEINIINNGLEYFKENNKEIVIIDTDIH
eukprot:236101_1